MATMQFELEMLGGAATSRLRRRRPAVDHLPWGTLDPATFTPDGLIEARKVWTNGVFTEYASAAAFSAMAGAFLECGAPIDLSAAAADIVVDELDHAEVASRLVMELGGAVPYHADLALVSPLTTPGVSPVVRAAELAITTSCVGEALSVSALSKSLAATEHPLVAGVLDHLLADEGPHSRVGAWFLIWAADRLSAGDRAHLATIALDAIAVYAPLWSDARCGSCEAPGALGGLAVSSHARVMVEAVRMRVARPLARLGIDLDRERLDALLPA
jgi:hypothetical protein